MWQWNSWWDVSVWLLSWCRAPPAGSSWSFDGGHQHVQAFQVQLCFLPDDLPGLSTTTLYTQNHTQYFCCYPLHKMLLIVLHQYLYLQCGTEYLQPVSCSIFSVCCLLGCLSTSGGIHTRRHTVCLRLMVKPAGESVKGNEVASDMKALKEVKVAEQKYETILKSWVIKKTITFAEVKLLTGVEACLSEFQSWMKCCWKQRKSPTVGPLKWAEVSLDVKDKKLKYKLKWRAERN